MTLRRFKRQIVRSLPPGVALDHYRHLDRAFDVCLAEFEPGDVEQVCATIGERGYGFPWMLLISIMVELLKYWLENRKHEERQAFLGWQREMKAINERAG